MRQPAPAGRRRQRGQVEGLALASSGHDGSVSEPLQVSRVVRGFPRRSLWLKALPVVLLAIAIVLLAPGWWVHAVDSAARWPRRFWLVTVFVLAAAVLSAGNRRKKAALMLGRPPRPPTMPLFLHVSLLLTVAAAVALAVAVLLWRALGEPNIAATHSQLPVSPMTSAWSTQDLLDAMKVVLTVVGGVGAVVALTVAYRRQRLHEVETYRDDTKVILDRFCSAAQLLGSPDAAVRIAGIYAYAALANDAPDARQGCIDVLCTYLRQPYNPPSLTARAPAALPAQANQPDATTVSTQTRRDPGQEYHVRLTIIRLIRDNLHLPDDDPRTWRGHDFNFTGAVFDGGDFAGATFNGTGTATFADAVIINRLSFAGATFASRTVSFAGARFVGGGVSFTGAKFCGGIVDLSKIDEQHPPPPAELWPAGIPVPAGLRLPPPQPPHQQPQP